MTKEDFEVELKDAKARAEILLSEYNRALGVIDFIGHALKKETENAES